MTPLPALEEEIKDACRAWVASGKRLVRGYYLRNDPHGVICGCPLTALSTYRLRPVHGMSAFVSGFDLGSSPACNNEFSQLGARIAAWAEQEGLLK